MRGYGAVAALGDKDLGRVVGFEVLGCGGSGEEEGMLAVEVMLDRWV